MSRYVTGWKLNKMTCDIMVLRTSLREEYSDCSLFSVAQKDLEL